MNKKYSYEVIKSKDDYDILSVDNGNKKVFSSSKYNTKREIDKLLEEIKENINSPVIVVYGLSNGEYIKELLYLGLRGHIYIVDYFDDLVKKYSEEYKNENLHIITFDDINNEKIDFEDSIATTVFYGNSFSIYKEEIEKCQEKIKKMLISIQINKNTINHFSYDWIENTLKNIKHIEKSHFINEYKDMYKGKPGVIVSAGPSLQVALPILKKHQDKFVIITGGRTLTTLKKHGIKVDFTCVVDAGKPSYDVIKEGLDYKTNLIFSDITNSKILDEYKGEKTYFSGSEFYDLVKEFIGEMPDIIKAGGSSVAHTCVGFADYIGCNSIIFLGQDMAFTNNKCHADDAYVKKVDEVNNNKEYIYVEDVYGEKVKTDLVLDMFRQQMEKNISVYNEKKEDKIEFINCSSGGANINGAKFEEFSNVVKKFNENVNIESCEKNTFNKLDNKKLQKKVKSLLEEVEEAKTLCRKAILYNKDLEKYHNKNKTKFNETMKKLDNIDKKIKKKSLSLGLIWSMAYIESDKILKNHKRHDLKEEKEVLSLVVKEGVAINESIANSLEKISPLIKELMYNIGNR